MIKIWGRANSVNVQKVLWCCDELSLPFERIDAGMQFGRTRDSDYLAMNPNGQIPTLVDGTFVLWESNSILRYLVTEYGAASQLYPDEPKIRASVDRWLDWSLSTLQPADRPVFLCLVRTPAAERDLAALDGGFDSHLTKPVHMPLVDAFLQRAIDKRGGAQAFCAPPVWVRAACFGWASPAASGERQIDVPLEAGARFQPLIPAFEIRHRRPLDADEPEPAFRKGAEHDVGDGELVAFKEEAALQVRVEHLPPCADGFQAGIQHGGIALGGRGSDETQEDGTFGGLQGGERPVEPAVDARPDLRFPRVELAGRAVFHDEVTQDRIRFPEHECAVD